MENQKGRLKILLTFGILFLTVLVLVLLVFFAGKKSYIVTFDLNGGTLISGSLEQTVSKGQDAYPPVAVKDGAYLRGWSASYKRITKDMVIEAVWEYETTKGIIYATGEHQNYAEIIGAYKYLTGDVYLGAYYGEKKILGIRESAFLDCAQIARVYLLDGLIYIGDSAFEGCSSLSEIEIPETVTHLGADAFSGCTSLEKIVLHEGLIEIGARAFEGCTALKEVVLPASLMKIGANAFSGCEDLVVTVTHTEEKSYDGWVRGWEGDAEIIAPEGVTVVNPALPDIIYPPLIFPPRREEDVDLGGVVVKPSFKDLEELKKPILREDVIWDADDPIFSDDPQDFPIPSFPDGIALAGAFEELRGA